MTRWRSRLRFKASEYATTRQSHSSPLLAWSGRISWGELIAMTYCQGVSCKRWQWPLFGFTLLGPAQNRPMKLEQHDASCLWDQLRNEAPLFRVCFCSVPCHSWAFDFLYCAWHTAGPSVGPAEWAVPPHYIFPTT